MSIISVGGSDAHFAFCPRDRRGTHARACTRKCGARARRACPHAGTRARTCTRTYTRERAQTQADIDTCAHTHTHAPTRKHGEEHACKKRVLSSDCSARHHSSGPVATEKRNACRGVAACNAPRGNMLERSVTRCNALERSVARCCMWERSVACCNGSERSVACCNVSQRSFARCATSREEDAPRRANR